MVLTGDLVIAPDARTPNFKLELFSYFRVPQLSVVPACLVSSRRPRQAVVYLVPSVTPHHCSPLSQVKLGVARNCMISYL
jgi:hypothetical protein